MHTVPDVVMHIIEWLVGGEKEIKLRSAEMEFGTKRRRIEEKIKTLSKHEKERGNIRCKKLQFPSICAGIKDGLIFDKPKIVLKNTHGWTEVYNWILLMHVKP